MVPILNAIGVHAAQVGNHDFDFGVDVLRGHMDRFNFPWLLSNVLDPVTRQPLGGAHRTLLMDWQGVRIGLVGLVEREWLLTIPSLDGDKDIIYLDFVEEGRKLARELQAQGAEIVVALTHMRGPNDEHLAGSVPEIHLLLGGHDHDYKVTATDPYGTMIIKSGTDFREFSVVRVTLDERRRLRVACERIEVWSSVPEAPDVAEIVQGYQALMGARMDEPMGRTFTALDARFDAVRCRESNVGNLMADIMRLGLGADAALLNGGTIRSDQIHPAGRLCMRDFVSMLPFTDELVVLRLSGVELLDALETGVSSWPKREGRFLQVSGIGFTFDPRKPRYERVDPGSVIVGGQPLDLERQYTVCTKAYLRSGKDGFDALRYAAVEVDGETAPRLATLVFYLLSRIEGLNREYVITGKDVDCSAEGARLKVERNGSVLTDGDGMPTQHGRLCPVREAPCRPAPCAHGLDALYFWDNNLGQYGIAPQIEGRIINTAIEVEQHQSDVSVATSVSKTP